MLGMTVQVADIERRFRLAAVVLGVGFALCVLLLTWTAWGHRVDDEAYFGAKLSNRAVASFEGSALNLLTPATALVLLAALLLFSWFRRAPVAGGLLAAGVAAAWIGAELIKHFGPWRDLTELDAVLPAGLRAMTAPSGHTTGITAFALAFALMLPTRWRLAGGLAAAFLSGAAGLAVVIAGWHKPSDAVIGVIWAGLWMSLAVVATIRLQLVREAVVPTGSIPLWVIAATCVACAQLCAVIVLALNSSAGPDADAAYVLFSVATLVLAYSVCPYLVWSTRPLDWRR